MHPSPSLSLAKTNRKTIQKGSKTFSLAAAFFGSDVYEAATALYAWCRYCDDQIDEAASSEIAKQRLEELKIQTRAAINGEPTEHSVFQGLSLISRRYRLCETYLFDLLTGMEMDTQETTYSTLEELETYGYHVAGCVGLLMCQFMGVSSDEAYPLASHLGIAMQLTNIARDVREDSIQTRLYLPLKISGIHHEWTRAQWLAMAQDSTQNARVFPIVLQLLARADEHYSRGLSGLKFLPYRAALAVRTAALIYREIGHQIRRRGPEALNSRSIVSPARKSWLVIQVMFVALLEWPARLLTPMKLNQKTPTWRYP